MRATVALVVLLGCQSTPVDPAGRDVEGCLELGALELFVADVETMPAAVQHLTLSNPCSGPTTVTALTLDDSTGSFSAGAPGFPLLDSGSETTVPVTFRPPRRGSFAGFVEVVWDGGPTRELEVFGKGVGPALELVPVRVDLGDVPVGCPTTTEVELRSVGEVAVDVLAVELDDAGWRVDPLRALPRELAPSHRLPVQITATPGVPGSISGEVSIVTGQASLPDLTLPVSATGVPIETHTQTWDFSSRRDVLVLLDRSVGAVPYQSEVVDATDAFIRAAADHGADLQLAYVVADDGCVVGPDPLIDMSFSESDAVRTARTMADLSFSLASYGSNTERPLMLAQAATSESNLGPGGCNEALVRDGAELHLISVTDEEGGSGNWADALTLFRDVKGRDDLFVHHALAGPSDSSCSIATAAPLLEDLTTATGGTFRSLCDPIPSSVQAIADAAVSPPSLEQRRTLVPERPPIVPTLAVTVDGVPSSDWVWDVERGAITFGADSVPAANAVVVASFVPVPDCR